MAPDTGSTKPDPPGLALRWSGRIPLAWRILAVNTLPLALLAGSFFYIDGFRGRLIEERRAQAVSEARLIAQAVQTTPQNKWRILVDRLDENEEMRIRMIDATGLVIADSWSDGRKSFTLRDPLQEGWQRQVARALDETFDLVVDATIPPSFVNYEVHLPVKRPDSLITLAPDRSHMIESRAKLEGSGDFTIVTLRNARDIRRLVRSERSQLGLMLAIATAISILLSFFLARTIVRPLQSLAHAAQQVRFGQAREVQVPRLPTRRDEIGLLARSISDMSHSLRRRMDATEAFAADVAHEFKNPLASLSSAVEGLRSVKDAALRDRLYAVISDDVRRLDRLVTDVSDLSRVDAHIAKSRFEKIDIAALIETMLNGRKDRAFDRRVQIAFARPHVGSALVACDPAQLVRVFDNLLDNAVSFSPEGGVVRIAATLAAQRVIVTVDDDGPGVPESARDSVFERFHSDRPDEQFGKHSGLGLSIARSIVEAHGGTISLAARDSNQTGASFIVELPPALG